MEVTITADQWKGRPGYTGAVLMLPADKYAVEDALERACVPEGGAYHLGRFRNWPPFLFHIFTACSKTLEGLNLQEVNFLAHKIQLMDETEKEAYEGILKLKEEADISRPLSMRDLINALYNMDKFTFFPGVTNDYELGEICLQCDAMDEIINLPDEVYDLLDEEKIGAMQRKNDQGTFTGKGYIYGKLEEWREVYDGEKLLWLSAGLNSPISLLLGSVYRKDREVWLALPATEKAMQEALNTLGESTFDNCTIKKGRSILPSLSSQLAGDEDIGKLNILAERLQALYEKHMLAKYKAALELECCNDLDMELDIAANLDCYNFDSVIRSAVDYAYYVLEEAGIDTSDPAFDFFNFAAFGERQLQKSGFVQTAYGCIGRSGQPFITEYTMTEDGQSM